MKFLRNLVETVAILAAAPFLFAGAIVLGDVLRAWR
jgi:hypothetical protein